MKNNNKELAAQILEAIYAKDKLEDVEKLISSTSAEKIDKQKLKNILEKRDNDFMEW